MGHFGFFLLSGEENVLADFYDSKSICQGYSRSPGDIRRKNLKKKWVDYNGRGENPFLMSEGHPGGRNRVFMGCEYMIFRIVLENTPKNI